MCLGSSSFVKSHTGDASHPYNARVDDIHRAKDDDDDDDSKVWYRIVVKSVCVVSWNFYSISHWATWEDGRRSPLMRNDYYHYLSLTFSLFFWPSFLFSHRSMNRYSIEECSLREWLCWRSSIYKHQTSFFFPPTPWRCYGEIDGTWRRIEREDNNDNESHDGRSSHGSTRSHRAPW